MRVVGAMTIFVRDRDTRVTYVHVVNVFDAEIALDRLDARLASELPAHIAETARAYADGTHAPAALAITPRESDTVVIARTFPELRTRATRLMRLVAPIVIEAAPSVITARSCDRTWDHWRALAAARDAVARQRFGSAHRTLVHALAGVVSHASRSTPIPPPFDEWTAEAPAKSDDWILGAWAALREPHSGALSILRTRTAHPRTFIVERGARAIIVVPARIATLAAQFVVLHELGHARLWLAPISRQHEWPRALDEAAASAAARSIETTALAVAVRARRLAIAHALDAIEAGDDPGDIARPPWALWTDPHAQAAYIVAERIADALGDVHALAEQARAIDAREW